MSKRLQIQTVMSHFPHAIGVDQPTSVAEKMMEEHNIRHLPVQDTGRLIGVVTSRDIDFARARDAGEMEHAFVRDIFTNEPYIVEPTTPISAVARHMAHEHIGCALIAEAGKLLGVFTTVDACRTLAESLSGHLEQ